MMESHTCIDVPTCAEETYFNNLACACFSNYFCEIGCMPGTVLPPDDICGGCTPIEEVRNEFFPSWATDEDIINSGYYLWEFAVSDN